MTRGKLFILGVLLPLIFSTSCSGNSSPSTPDADVDRSPTDGGFIPAELFLELIANRIRALVPPLTKSTLVSSW